MTWLSMHFGVFERLDQEDLHFVHSPSVRVIHRAPVTEQLAADKDICARYVNDRDNKPAHDEAVEGAVAQEAVEQYPHLMRQMNIKQATIVEYEAVQ